MEGKITNAIQKQTAVAERKPKTMVDFITERKDDVAQALPSVLTPERFTRMALNALNVNSKLRECTPMSFVGAMMQAAQLGLEPNTPLGEAYLIPRKNYQTGAMECSFQLGYHGILSLAHRSEQLKDIYAHTVYANDYFVYELGLETKLIHKPAATNRGDPVYFYAVYHTKAGGSGFEVMSIEDVRKHAAKHSDGYRSGKQTPWKTDFEAMAKKTVLIQALKYAPKSTEVARGLASDNTVKPVISEDMALEPDTTVETDFADVDPDTGEIKEAALANK